MPITLTPEQEAEVRADAEASGFENVELYLADRLASLHAEVQYFAENRGEFDRLIAEGIAQADRGELMSPEEAKADIEKSKRALMANASAA